MARHSRAAELGLVALTIEGGLIAPEQVQKVIAADRTAKTAASYACPKGTSLGDEIARYFRIGQAIWRDYDKAERQTITRTAAFARDILTQCLGFADVTGPVEHQDGSRRYRLAWEAKGGRVPVVVAAPTPGADSFSKSQPEFGDGEGGRPKRSPAALLQDWLNANPTFYWGLVFAGDRVRLLRDNASLTRPAWIEADLGAMFRDEMFADFTAFWLLAHATRFGAEGAAASDCALEQWREAGQKQGVQARAELRNNVEEALRELGQGLVEANPMLVERLQSGALSMPTLFQELLRTIYRLIFLAVAEDRDLLHARQATLAARQLYADGYSFTFWRERSRRRVAHDGHHDAWEAGKVTLASLERGQDLLGLPALGGLFAASTTPNLNDAKIPNRRFLAALFCLGFIRKDGVTHRINWRDLKTEELGSVYESLLEIRPSLTAAGTFDLSSGAKGNDRKTSGSYYTPDSLVECLLDSALNPVLERAEASGATAAGKVAAILALKVIDPACGSGHFLLGAARRMADRVARLRNEDAGKEDVQAALRDVVSRCIHGVDRNPMAVELAKVALWIETVSPGQPLGFLDANLRCGDALLGVFDLAALDEGIPDEAYKPLTGDNKDAAKFYQQRNRDAKKGQGQLDFLSGGGAMPPRRMAAGLGTIKSMPEDTVGQVEKKRAAFEAWNADPARWNTQVACDLYMAAFLLPKNELPAIHLRGMVPTTAEVRQKLAGGSVYGPLEAAGVDVARFASVLHWPLEFPDVMIANGGFDVVLGNPPWEVVQLGEEEFFALRAPEVAELKGTARKMAIAALAQDRPSLLADFTKEKRGFEAANEFARASKRFSRTARNKINTYSLFTELSISLMRDKSSIGIIVQSGIVTENSNSELLKHILKNGMLVSFYDLVNTNGIFPGVHRTHPHFCLLTMISGGADAAMVSFFNTSVEHLRDTRRLFPLTAETLELFNPNNGVCPAFRSMRDEALTRAIQTRVPILILEAGEISNDWQASIGQNVFSHTTDGERFASLRSQILAAEGSFSRCALTSLGMLPLYEGKMVDQYDHRFGSFSNRTSERGNRVLPDPTIEQYGNPEYEPESYFAVDRTDVSERLAVRNWSKEWIIVWKDITTSVTDRTTKASIIPLSGTDDTLSVVAPQVSDPKLFSAILANLNALPLDYVARQKVTGVHLRRNVFVQLPILPPRAYNETDLAFIASRVLALSYTSHAMAPFARDLGYDGEPFAWDEDRRAHVRAELDAWYALAYGLTRDELRYVLDPKDVMGADYPSETFRVLQNNEMKKYGEYRTRRLVLAAYDELLAQGLRPRTEGYR